MGLYLSSCESEFLFEWENFFVLRIAKKRIFGESVIIIIEWNSSFRRMSKNILVFRDRAPGLSFERIGCTVKKISWTYTGCTVKKISHNYVSRASTWDQKFKLKRSVISWAIFIEILRHRDDFEWKYNWWAEQHLRFLCRFIWRISITYIVQRFVNYLFEDEA